MERVPLYFNYRKTDYTLISRGRGASKLPASHLPHVFLTLWIHEENPQHYQAVLAMFTGAVGLQILRCGDRAWSDIYDEFAVDADADRALKRTLQRDFRCKADKGVKSIVYALVSLTDRLRPSHDPGFDMTDVPSRKVSFACLAGWRTVMCSLGKENVNLGDGVVKSILSLQLNILA